ncbi:zona pellucida sperm-binding protein 3-like [Hoplias malabaricus]|uniref:zona pellucida sperm-binding protein 3-like n=1 Tax=Hoplias malabaricus TaxID=27720 RepID=UPI003461A8C0
MILTLGALLVLFVTSVLAQDVLINCKADSVTVKWRPVLTWGQKLDPSKARLGSCSPLSSEEDVLLFFVWLHECGFKRLVSHDKVTYTNVLTYGLDHELPPVPVECVYDLLGTDSEKTQNDHVFRIEFMNSDFSGPAPSSMYTVGSRISIKAEVEQLGFEPLQIYLQSCVLATAPELVHASQLHTVISNAGCLIESKEGNSSFLPREKHSEIRFYFQAFKFALGENIFLHCDMAAWDLQSFSTDKKACHYLKEQRVWELLDDPSQSYICRCCYSKKQLCIQKNNLESGLSVQKVIGPFTIVEDAQSNAEDLSWTEGELSGVPVWVLVVIVPLVLLLLAGAIATTYYLCFWRGGRLGYRPSRDLLNKY